METNNKTADNDAEIAKLTADNMRNESLLQKAGETVVGLMNKMSAQDEEIKKLRTLVNELAEHLFNNPCTGCEMYCCAICKHRREADALVARARKEAEDGK